MDGTCDVEELLVECGIEVDHLTVHRWVQRFTPLLTDCGTALRHSPGDWWFVDETYVKVNGTWRHVYRAVDQHGQIIDVLVSKRRDGDAARCVFKRALTTLTATPTEVITDAAPVYPGSSTSWSQGPRPRDWCRRRSPWRSRLMLRGDRRGVRCGCGDGFVGVVGDEGEAGLGEDL
jgi:transposase-like protein